MHSSKIYYSEKPPLCTGAQPGHYWLNVNMYFIHKHFYKNSLNWFIKQLLPRYLLTRTVVMEALSHTCLCYCTAISWIGRHTLYLHISLTIAVYIVLAPVSVSLSLSRYLLFFFPSLSHIFALSFLFLPVLSCSSVWSWHRGSRGGHD